MYLEVQEAKGASVLHSDAATSSNESYTRPAGEASEDAMELLDRLDTQRHSRIDGLISDGQRSKWGDPSSVLPTARQILLQEYENFTREEPLIIAEYFLSQVLWLGRDQISFR